MKVLFFGQITKLWKLRGRVTPSTLLRCMLLSRELEKLGFSCEVRYCTSKDFRVNLRQVRSSDIVVFHRLQFPMTTRLEPPTELFLHIAGKAARKVTVFDFDDAIFLHYPVLTEFFVANSDLVMVGSHQLASFAAKWNKRVHIIPSPANTEIFSPTIRKPKEPGKCLLGWHGTAYIQLENLRILIPVLRRLARRYEIALKLLGTMGDRRLQSIFRTIKGLEVDFGPNEWIPYDNLPALIADVDIGLSPLRDSLWSRCKCAMKAIEYMSMAIPVVASPVGEHNYLIRDGINGLLASTEDEWVRKVSMLIEDESLRERLGNQARSTVVENYSLSVIAEKFAKIVRTSEEKR